MKQSDCIISSGLEGWIGTGLSGAWALPPKLFPKQLEVSEQLTVFCLNQFLVGIYGVLLNGLSHKSSWLLWKSSSAKWNFSFLNCRNSEKAQRVSIWKCFCVIFWYSSGTSSSHFLFLEFWSLLPGSPVDRSLQDASFPCPEYNCRSTTGLCSKWEYLGLKAEIKHLRRSKRDTSSGKLPILKTVCRLLLSWNNLNLCSLIYISFPDVLLLEIFLLYFKRSPYVFREACGNFRLLQR